MVGLAGLIVAANLDAAAVVLTDGNTRSTDNVAINVACNSALFGSTDVSASVLLWDENADLGALGGAPGTDVI